MGFQKGKLLKSKSANYMPTVFLELKKGHNEVQRHYTLKQFIATGLNGKMMHFIRNFFRSKNKENLILNDRYKKWNTEANIRNVLFFIISVKNVENYSPAPIKCR